MSNPDNPIVTATYFNGAVTVLWTVPANSGGAPISGYSVSIAPDGIVEDMDSRTLSCMFEDFENDRERTFSVVAINYDGYHHRRSSGASITLRPEVKPVEQTKEESIIKQYVSPVHLGFPEGVLVMTPSGQIRIEDLSSNQLVLLSDGRQVPVIVTSKTFEVDNDTAPYLIPKEVFGFPCDLMLSPFHAFQVKKGTWNTPIHAAELNSAIRQYNIGSTMTYYQIECLDFLQDDLLINRCVVESLGSNQHPGLRRLAKYNKRLRLKILSGE
uniref:Fibronectin type-III domain-containing protein n=1 Tax=viral metagenome TaxID=1070528 RepID=A0A6C0AQ53_9ZZZZ